MQRHAEHVSRRQTQISFDLMEQPMSASPLRVAYARLELSRNLSFEQAMANPVYAIGIRNLADAMARRAASHSFGARTRRH